MLTKVDIEKGVLGGRIIITPFNPSALNPNSYNLSLDRTLATYKKDVLDTRIRYSDEDLNFFEIGHDGHVLRPGILYLGSTVEVAGSDYYIPSLEGRSSIARVGLQVHLSAGFGDLGFKGRWVLELMAVQPVRVYAGTQICQVAFHKTSSIPDELYSGKYSEQCSGIIPSRGV